MEAFNEPLSAETSLPTATKCLCENKSTEWLHRQETVFTLPGYFQFRFVGTVLHCLLPSVWILDLYARPCSLTRHCCWRKDVQKIIVNLPVAIGCAITLPQLMWWYSSRCSNTSFQKIKIKQTKLPGSHFLVKARALQWLLSQWVFFSALLLRSCRGVM